MPEKEAVITGMGLVTPLGLDVSENWENLLARKTGIAYYSEPERLQPGFSYYQGRVLGYHMPEDLPHKLLSQMRFLNRGSLLGFGAAREAILQADSDVANVHPGRRALYIASGDMTNAGCAFLHPALKDGSHGTWRDMDFQKLNSSALAKVNPFFLLESLANNLFSFLSAFLEFMGPNTSLASHSPCGMQALDLAHRSIIDGEADIAMVVGCGNWITEIPLYEMNGLGLVSKCKHGAQSFKPFDRHRDGFIAGEGGAAILLESSERATDRGAKVFAKIKGCGNGVEPSPTPGLSLPSAVCRVSMENAMVEASCDTRDLAFVCPHGSGTQKGDRSELMSFVEVAGNDRSKVPVCGLKPYTGHMAAASDVAEIILGIIALTNGLVPATLNFTEPDSVFNDLNISNNHQKCDNRHFISTGYGIVGQSSSVVVEVL